MYRGDIMSYRVNLTKNESPSHKHKNYEIIIYTKGEGNFSANGKTTAVFPGKITIIPPGVTHTTTFSDNLDRIYIQGDFDQIFSVSSPVVISDNQQGEGMQLGKMIYNSRFSDNEYTTALVNAFAHFLLRNITIYNEINTAIKDIINKILNDFYDCDLNLNYLLNNSGYAEDYIRTHFKKITGKTPVEFLTKMRINHACYLIDVYKGTLTLSEIAMKCGYSDYVYFSRRFKKITGMSPREYMSI